MQLYLGTWQVAPSDGFWTDQDTSESESVISTAVRLGIHGFDTAQSYGKGRSEQTLAKVLRRFLDVSCALAPLRPCHPKIDTKIMPSTKEPSALLRTSLDRLKPFSVDCLYLHWPRTGFDNAAFIAEMLKLKEQNLASKVGVCNIPLEMLKTFVKAGLAVDRIQIPISLLWTRDLAETMQFCKESNIEVAAYSPTGMGLLSGKYRSPEDLHDARANLFCFNENCRKPYHTMLDLLSETAKNHKTSNTKIALSWVASKNPDIMVIGARNKAQLKENLSEAVTLSDSELSDLNQAAEELDKASQAVCENIFSYNW